MDIILHLPGVEKIRFAQGLLGAKTAKPTELLRVNLPSMMQHLHANRVRKELPRGQSVYVLLKGVRSSIVQSDF